MSAFPLCCSSRVHMCEAQISKAQSELPNMLSCYPDIASPQAMHMPAGRCCPLLFMMLSLTETAFLRKAQMNVSLLSHSDARASTKCRPYFASTLEFLICSSTSTTLVDSQSVLQENSRDKLSPQHQAHRHMLWAAAMATLLFRRLLGLLTAKRRAP